MLSNFMKLPITCISVTIFLEFLITGQTGSYNFKQVSFMSTTSISSLVILTYPNLNHFFQNNYLRFTTTCNVSLEVLGYTQSRISKSIWNYLELFGLSLLLSIFVLKILGLPGKLQVKGLNNFDQVLLITATLIRSWRNLQHF